MMVEERTPGIEAVNKPKVDQGERPNTAVKEHRPNAGVVQDVFALRFELSLSVSTFFSSSVSHLACAGRSDR